MSSSLESGSVGFNTATITIGLPFSPIHIFSNAQITRIVSAPPLPEGMVINVDKRTISGVYDGDEMEEKYSLICSGKNSSIVVPLGLSFSKHPILVLQAHV